MAQERNMLIEVVSYLTHKAGGNLRITGDEIRAWQAENGTGTLLSRVTPDGGFEAKIVKDGQPQ